MTSRYAKVLNGLVVEFLDIDSTDDIATMFPPDLVWVDVTSVSPAPDFDWSATSSGGAWTFSAPEPIVPSEDELKSAALAERDILLAAANSATAGMTDAYVAGLLDAADKSKFENYAAYKLLLNKIETQTGYPGSIAWPSIPAT